MAIIKRFRNNILARKIFLAPKLNEIPEGRTVFDYTTPFSKEFYLKIVAADSTSIVSIARLPEAAIKLTPRTKQSFPLAKSLFNGRTQLTLDLLEAQARREKDFATEYSAYTAKAVSNWANMLLARTRSRVVLDGVYRNKASQQIYELYSQFTEWRRRNVSFSARISALNPDFPLILPNQKQRDTTYGFFDKTFCQDLSMTLLGLSILSVSSPQICLRFITTDCLESFFSTIRSCTKAGGGQLTVRAHRLAARRAVLARVHMLSYLGDMIPRKQPLINEIIGKKKRKPDPIPEIDIEDLTIPDIELRVVDVTEHQQSVIRYISGWLIHSLMKRFPDDEKLINLIDRRVQRLIKPSLEFEQAIKTVMVAIHGVMAENAEKLSSYPSTHQLLVRILTQRYSSQLVELFHTEEEKKVEHILLKISMLMLADHARKIRKLMAKSFRNELK